MKNVEEFNQIIVSSVRYALGRRTYIVKVTADYIKSVIDVIDEKFIDILINDIRNANDYGDNCDKEVWMDLLTFLEDEKKKRN